MTLCKLCFRIDATHEVTDVTIQLPNNSMTAELLAVTDPAGVVLCDPFGQVLGRFFPIPPAELPEPHIVDGNDAPPDNSK